MLFPTTVIGSMPRPKFVRDLLDEDHPELSPADFRRRMDAAVAYVVQLQEAAGIDFISDGEWRRRSYIGVIADLMDGFERGVVDGRSWHTVVRPMRKKRAGVIADEVKFLKRTTRRGIKVALPSPYLLGQRMWDPKKSRKAYPTRRDFMEDLVPVLRRELLLVREAGADVAQFDDPHICLFVDRKVRAQHADPDAEVAFAVDLLNKIVDGVEGITLAIHLCRRNKARAGWVGEGGYGPIIPHLNRLNVHQYMLEYTIPVAGDFEVLRALRKDRLIGLGCVDCRGEKIDSPEEIAARVKKAVKHVDPKRVWLNPDCGFAPGSAADIPVDEAYAKLKNEAAAARLLRKKYRKI